MHYAAFSCLSVEAHNYFIVYLNGPGIILYDTDIGDGVIGQNVRKPGGLTQLVFGSLEEHSKPLFLSTAACWPSIPSRDF